MKQYFLTEVSGGVVQGHDFGSSKMATDYFDQAQKIYPQAEFVNLVRLNIALQDKEGSETEIVLNKYNNQLESELKIKYPEAEISHFDQF
ncbi:hypothetical protein [Lactococcus protaetiae]|uniref:Uncharacterized protein n=1 Tax=Lactococcus protaetiae TaxID=2592653 RepID=A0A514Z7R9_9LACT|nr:hypothetical protein [Lactococcus protaetiae]QDK70634.1 hypothetical protein FLP15_04925 [Lactococcus protaetiae]